MSTVYESPDVAMRAREAESKALENGGPLGESLTINMGPSHPSTHGVLRIVLELDGEVITKATPDIGYLHRGDEKIAETMQYNQFVPYTDRLDYLAPMANNVAYALAVEKLMDWKLPPRGQAIRVLCCELARISSHLLGIGCYAMDIGAMTVFLYTFTQRETIYNLCEQLTGARFTTTYTRIGGMTRDMPEDFPSRVRAFIKELLPCLDEIDKLLTRNPIWLDRTKNVGTITREDALAYGITGPNLRSTGADYDIRKAHPYLGYEHYDFEVPVGTVGDCFDRYLVRMEEMRQSARILEQALTKMPTGPVCVENPKGLLPVKPDVLTKMEELIHQFILVTQGIDAPAGEVYSASENPKGELGFYINSRGGGVPYRLKIRAPSFANLSILPKILPGHYVSDVPAILGSIDFVMGECDR